MAAIHLTAQRPVAFRQVLAALRSPGSKSVIGGTDQTALHVHMGSLEVVKPVVVETGDVEQTTEPVSSVSVPFNIKAAHGAGWYPIFEGDLEVVPAGGGSVEIAMEGRYRPPVSWLGELADAVVLHKLAEESLGRFFDEVVERLHLKAMSSTELAGHPFT